MTMEDYSEGQGRLRSQSIIQVTLPKKGGEGDEIKRKLSKIASENYRSLSSQVLIILRDYLNRMEDGINGTNE